jgi:hypothetical protein
VKRGEPDGPLTGAWEAVRRVGDGGEGSGGRNSDAERAQARRVGNGGEDECGEEGRAPHPFIRSEGERGGRTLKGIGRPVVAASMPVVRFNWEGKWRGEWGVGSEEGESVAPFLGEEGSSGRRQRAREVVAAVPDRASGGRRRPAS